MIRGIGIRLLVVLALMMGAIVPAAASTDPAAPVTIATGGGWVKEPPPRDEHSHFQVHRHSFAFTLTQEGCDLVVNLTYHDHHEGAATRPIFNEPVAFSVHATEARTQEWYRDGKSIRFRVPAQVTSPDQMISPTVAMIDVTLTDAGKPVRGSGGLSNDQFSLTMPSNGYFSGLPTVGGGNIQVYDVGGCSPPPLPPLPPMLPPPPPPGD